MRYNPKASRINPRTNIQVLGSCLIFYLFILFRRLCIVSWGFAKSFGALHSLLGLYIICWGLSAALQSLHVGALFSILMCPHPNLSPPHSPPPRAPRHIGPRRCGRSPPPLKVSLSIYIHIYEYKERERKKCICAVHSCHRDVFLFKQAESSCVCCRTS